MAKAMGLAPEVVAYHEAGHAVVAWRLGVGIRRASIVPEEQDGSAGHVLNRKLLRQSSYDIELADRFSPSRLQAEKRVMVSMAGELAQRRFRQHSVRAYHVSSDREHIIDILTRYAACPGPGEPIDITTHYNLLREWTNAMLENDWYLVEAFADALIERRTLSSSEVRETLLAAMDKKFNRPVGERLRLRQVLAAALRGHEKIPKATKNS
jgi:hypothetical protein